MSMTTSRLPKEEHPPLCRALKVVMTVTGTTGVELARLLDRSQSAVARYYADREPDMAMTVEIEHALGLPPGTLFSLAGYTASSWDTDSLGAIMADDTLTEAQRQGLVYILIEALRERGAHAGQADSLKAIEKDNRIPTVRKRMLTQMIASYRTENIGRAKPKRVKR